MSDMTYDPPRGVRQAAWRIVVRVDEDAVVIAEVFEKKTRATPASRLEEARWRVGTAADFLGLTQEETALIEMKLGLAATLRKRRQARRLTQTQLAKQLGSSQSRVAKMEAADPSVSIDLLVRTLLELGATRAQVANAMTKRVSRAA